jgi:hypothetical protein
LADIDSGTAIIFTHSWSEKKSTSKNIFDTTKIAFYHIPSGLRDTFYIQPKREKMNLKIDSVVLEGITFR